MKKIVEKVVKKKPPRDPYRFLILPKDVFSLAIDGVFKAGNDDLKEKWGYYLENGYKIYSITHIRQVGIMVCFTNE